MLFSYYCVYGGQCPGDTWGFRPGTHGSLHSSYIPLAPPQGLPNLSRVVPQTEERSEYENATSDSGLAKLPEIMFS